MRFDMSIDFEKFAVGDVINFEKEFTLTDFENFSKISGDFNPLHHNKEYAALHNGNNNIVPLHLIIAPLSRVAGMNFPGTPSLYLSHSVRAISQLRYEEKITYSAKILAINSVKRVMTIKVIGFVGKKVIFDAELKTRALRSEWDQEIDCEIFQDSSKGRVLITGSSGAIGSAIANKFAREGWPLLLQSRSKRDASEIISMDKNNISIELVKADLSTKKGIDTLIKKIDLLGDIGTVIHTASPPLNSPFKDLAEINYTALKTITEAAVPDMLKKQKGKIALIGSTAMMSMIDGLEDYAASKSMAASYLKRLDSGLGHYGINGYVFAPDFVSTEYSEKIRGNSPSLLPEEVASKLYKMLTSESSFMTVQYLDSLMDGSYGFSHNSQSNDNLLLNSIYSKNDKDKIDQFIDDSESKLVKCIQLILPNASYEQIRDGGMGITPGWDSLAQIQVILEVEKLFEHRFTSSDFENLKTFNGILKVLN